MRCHSLHLENRISDHLDTFLTGPSEQGQATLEDAPRPPVDAQRRVADEDTHTFLFGSDNQADPHLSTTAKQGASGSIRPQNSLWRAVSQRLRQGQ